MCVCWMLVECFDLCLLSDTADCRQLSAVASWSLSAPLSQTLSAVCSVWHRLQSRRSRHRRLCCQYPCFVFTLRPLYELLSTDSGEPQVIVWILTHFCFFIIGHKVILLWFLGLIFACCSHIKKNFKWSKIVKALCVTWGIWPVNYYVSSLYVFLWNLLLVSVLAKRGQLNIWILE